MSQFYLSAKQQKLVAELYGKVDYLITDSPIHLGSIYDDFYNESHSGYMPLFIVNDEFITRADKKFNNVRLRVFIERDKPYLKHGRYQDEEQAREIDTLVQGFLDFNMYIKSYETSKIFQALFPIGETSSGACDFCFNINGKGIWWDSIK